MDWLIFWGSLLFTSVYAFSAANKDYWVIKNDKGYNDWLYYT